MRFLLVCAFAAALLASSAQAGAVFDRLSGSDARADPCFARFYDAAHLARHARQRVTRISVRRQRGGPRREDNSARFTVALAFRLTGGSEMFAVHGICVPRGPLAECDGEGDTGRFRLMLSGANLRVDIERLELE